MGCDRCSSIHDAVVVDGHSYCIKCYNELQKIWAPKGILKAYLVQNISTGEYSTGGDHPYFYPDPKKAKVWFKISPARSFMTRAKRSGRYDTSSWRIFEFSLTNPKDVGM